jgi:hypothetical protein
MGLSLDSYLKNLYNIAWEKIELDTAAVRVLL